jgi:hypothetical protein
VPYYSNVLELLVEQFEHDRPIHSAKAVALAEKLYDHSYDLFDRIRDLIPGGHRARDHLSFLQRIAWNFKKTKVDLLVGELEKLKSTVRLLVQVLCAAFKPGPISSSVGHLLPKILADIKLQRGCPEA